jgi:predicted 3-demethylubiquinone-9 3-methyltransferase (glyoxalase superfamily)
MDSAGPHRFTFTPAISLVVECDREDELDAADGATVLMPLQAYDFSPRFGWQQDRFGVTWQLSLV